MESAPHPKQVLWLTLSETAETGDLLRTIVEKGDGRMSEVLNVEKLFGENVFTLERCRSVFPKKAFAEVKRVMEHGGELDNATADVVAKTMKDWAVEHGATITPTGFQP